jgi:hypothetical protein
MVPVGLQQVLELGAVSSAVVMKVARIECAEEPRSNLSSPAYFAHHTIDRVGVQVPALLLLMLAVVLERPDQGAVDAG